MDKQEKKYKHCISLGFFCSVALDLERMGLRETSSPFDWCISEFRSVISLIDNRFSNFLEYDNMVQKKNEAFQYKDILYNIAFLHDFNKYQSLESQLPEVKQKYARRIERFYKMISEPTLFVRYIYDDSNPDRPAEKELEWIEEKYDYIITVLRKFNPENDIIFVANTGVKSDVIDIFHVEKDVNDSVARKPVEKNADLYHLLDSIECKGREQNLKIYANKEGKKKNIFCVFTMKGKKLFQKMTSKQYVHNKQY